MTVDVADRPVVRTDQVTLGVLISQVSRKEVDAAIASCGAGEKRSDGKLPAHVTAYLTLGLALFPDDDYEEVATKGDGVVGAVRLLGRGLECADFQCYHAGTETFGA